MPNLNQTVQILYCQPGSGLWDFLMDLSESDLKKLSDENLDRCIYYFKKKCPPKEMGRTAKIKALQSML